MTTANDLLGPIHNSHLTAVRRCKQKFHYAFIEGIQPKMPALPLARGIWIHYCLEAQFLRWGIEDGTLLHIPEFINVDGVGPVYVDKDNLLLNVCLDESKDEWKAYDLSAAGMLRLLNEQVWDRLFPQEHEKYTEDNHTLPEAVQRILTEYFYYWKDKFQNRTFKILLVEAMWQNEYEGVQFEGRADYVIQEENGLIVCGDWKSTKREPHPEYKFMESQLHLYPWGLSEILVELGMDPKAVNNMAVEFDYLSTKLPTIPSQNQDGKLSKRKINTTYLTLVKALKMYGLKWKTEDIEAFLAKNEKVFFTCIRMPRNKKVVKALLEENVADTQIISFLVSGHMPPTRTVTYNCSFDCDFLKICKGELYGQDVRHVRKAEYEPRTNSHAGVVDKDD